MSGWPRRRYPRRRNGDTARLFIPVGKLFLPDNSLAGGLPVFIEGRLVRFERKIGVVVDPDAPSLADVSGEGTALFRGKWAVVLHGPAVVELAFPFRVERLPADPDNYWRDLRRHGHSLNSPSRPEQTTPPQFVSTLLPQPTENSLSPNERSG